MRTGLPPCRSTHGLAGYAPGTHWKDGKMVCGACGVEIENPPPTGGRWVPEKGWRGWFLGRGRWVPTWPAWVTRATDPHPLGSKEIGT
jgi:hypothetical protein